MAEIRTSAPERAKEYEAIYVLRPDIDAETAGRVSTRVADVIGREKAVLTKVESWGRRKLAYPVRKYRRGIYFYVRFVGGGPAVAELERNLRMQKDAVLKFQTIKLRDEVEVAQVKVDPEEVKFLAIEPPTDDDREESREKLLGLVDLDHGREERARDRDRMLDEAYAGVRGAAVDEDTEPSDEEPTERGDETEEEK